MDTRNIRIDVSKPFDATEDPDKALMEYLDYCAREYSAAGVASMPVVDVTWFDSSKDSEEKSYTLPSEFSKYDTSFLRNFVTRYGANYSLERTGTCLAVGALFETACAAGNVDFAIRLKDSCYLDLLLYFNSEDYPHEQLYKKLIKPAWSAERKYMVDIVYGLVANRFSRRQSFENRYDAGSSEEHNLNWHEQLLQNISIASLYEYLRMLNLSASMLNAQVRSVLGKVTRQEEFADYLCGLKLKSEDKEMMVENALFNELDWIYQILRLLKPASGNSDLAFAPLRKEYEKMQEAKPASHWYELLASEKMSPGKMNYALKSKMKILSHIDIHLSKEDQIKVITKILNQPHSQLGKFVRQDSPKNVEQDLQNLQRKLSELQAPPAKAQGTTVGEWKTMWKQPSARDVPHETAAEFLHKQLNSSKSFEPIKPNIKPKKKK